jgi:hypothetical protein
MEETGTVRFVGIGRVVIRRRAQVVIDVQGISLVLPVDTVNSLAVALEPDGLDGGYLKLGQRGAGGDGGAEGGEEATSIHASDSIGFDPDVARTLVSAASALMPTLLRSGDGLPRVPSFSTDASRAGKSAETSLGAADTSVRATSILERT